MNKWELEDRTKRFALRIIAFVASLPRGRIGDVIGYQLLKAGTSVGANYREANSAESRNDFIHKVAIVEKESSESRYWLELIHESNLGEVSERTWLLTEAGNFWRFLRRLESRQNLIVGARTNRTVKTKSEIRNPKSEIELGGD